MSPFSLEVILQRKQLSKKERPHLEGLCCPGKQAFSREGCPLCKDGEKNMEMFPQLDIGTNGGK